MNIWLFTWFEHTCFIWVVWFDNYRCIMEWVSCRNMLLEESCYLWLAGEQRVLVNLFTQALVVRSFHRSRDLTSHVICQYLPYPYRLINMSLACFLGEGTCLSCWVCYISICLCLSSGSPHKKSSKISRMKCNNLLTLQLVYMQFQSSVILIKVYASLSFLFFFMLVLFLIFYPLNLSQHLVRNVTSRFKLPQQSTLRLRIT